MGLPLARTLQVADSLAEQIKRFLIEYAPEMTVTRAYAPDLDDEIFATWKATLKSLGCFIVPMKKKTILETRATDEYQYTYGVVFAEKCTDAGEEGLPSNAWVDHRVAMVNAVEELIGDIRFHWDSGCNSDLRAIESEIVQLFDPDMLRETRTFYSLWILTLAESQEV